MHSMECDAKLGWFEMLLQLKESEEAQDKRWRRSELDTGEE